MFGPHLDRLFAFACPRDALENPGSERGLLACLRALHRAGVVVPEASRGCEGRLPG